MTTAAVSIRPRWMKTSDEHPIEGYCLSPCTGGWYTQKALSDPDLRKRIAEQIIGVNRKDAYLLATGKPPRLVERQEAWSSAKLGGGCVLHYQDKPADAMWLNRQSLLVTELTGKPMLFAVHGADCLALRFTNRSVRTILDAYGDGVNPEDIVVHALFGTHRKVADYYQELADACAEEGLRSHGALRLPLEGKFGYAQSESVKSPNLGLFSRRTVR